MRDLAVDVQVPNRPRYGVLQVGCHRIAGPDHGRAGLHRGETRTGCVIAGVGASGRQGIGDTHTACGRAAPVLGHDLVDQLIAGGDPSRVLPQVLGDSQIGLGGPDIMFEDRLVVVQVAFRVKAEDICRILHSGAHWRIVVHAHSNRQPPALEHRQMAPHPDYLVWPTLDQGEAGLTAGNIGYVLGKDVDDAHVVSNVATLVNEVDLVGDLVAGRKGVGFADGDILDDGQIGRGLCRTERCCEPGQQERACREGGEEQAANHSLAVHVLPRRTE